MKGKQWGLLGPNPQWTPPTEDRVTKRELELQLESELTLKKRRLSSPHITKLTYNDTQPREERSSISTINLSLENQSLMKSIQSTKRKSQAST